MWHHGSHAGDQEQKNFSPLVSKLNSIFMWIFFEKKFYGIDTLHGRLVTWLQTKNIEILPKSVSHKVIRYVEASKVFHTDINTYKYNIPANYLSCSVYILEESKIVVVQSTCSKKAGTGSGSPNNKRSSKTEIRGALLRLRSKCPPDYRGSKHTQGRTNERGNFAAKRHFRIERVKGDVGLGSKINQVSVGRGDSNRL